METKKDLVNSVSVGDTFLFSPGYAYRSLDNPSDGNNAKKHMFDEISAKWGHGIHWTDAYCLTSTIPYFRSFVAPGEEEQSAQRLLTCLKSHHM